MKKYYLFILVVVALSSCNKWLDVKPESQISKDELFETEEGFQEALNGVYTRCSRTDLYGGELTFGITEVLAQNYSVNDNEGPGDYKQIQKYNYKHNDFISKKDNLWKSLYNSIVNVNLILGNIDAKKGIFTSNNYAIIKGEALALRGYLHFDLFRLFGSSPAAGSTVTGIPYVDSYSNQVTAVSNGQEVLKRIIADLNQAKLILAPADSIRSARYKVGYTNIDERTDPALYAKEGGNETSSEVLFYQNRRHRMNYYAVCGELARVYLYQNDKDNALANAREVIQSQKFPFTSEKYFIETDVKLKDRILYKELLFGWYAPKSLSETQSKFQKNTDGFVLNTSSADNIYEKSGPGAEDLRFKHWYQFGTSNAYYELQKFNRNIAAREDDETANLHPLMMPAIRLSEMYYIAAESIYDKDPSGALAYLNTVRTKRNISTPVASTSKAEFMTELVMESRKELLGEGQLFYMYKRLNRAIVTQSGGIIPASNAIFVLPLPNDEIEFGGR